MTRRRATAVADDRLNNLPTEALECRDLRHAWPRGTGTVLMRPTRWRGQRVVEAEREMECTGGCGVTRIDVFAVGLDGRITRDTKPRYKYDPDRAYLVKRTDPSDPPVNRDAIRTALFTRMFPDLKW